MHHHLEITGETSMKIKSKINNIIIKTAKNILGKNAYGRTSEWILKELKWFNFETMYQLAVQKSTYKFINPEDGQNSHFFTDYMLTNRTVKNQAQNKIGPHKPNMGKKSIEQKTFLYKSVDMYNKLRREITLLPNLKLFKIWLKKKYHMNKQISIPKREDNKKILERQKFQS